MARLLVGIAVWLLGLGFTTLASSQPLVSSYYTRTGQAEALVAPLSVFGGVTTSQLWSGQIELTVSGVGYNFPAPGGFTDAFYYYAPGTPDVRIPERDDQNWGLRMSFSGCAASFECGAPSILDFIVFSEGLGAVTPLANFLPGDPEGPLVMPYRADHIYHFVIDVRDSARNLTLGYGDGGVSDNGGQFDIRMFAVTAVPEPATYALLLGGLAFLLLVVRRQTQTGGAAS